MFYLQDEAVKNRLIEKIEANKFGSLIGIEYTQISEGYVEGKVLMREELLQQDGYAHGGLISSLADMVAGFASYTVIDTDQRVLTAEIKVSFYRAGKGDILYARGEVAKKGRRFIFSEAVVYTKENHQERVIAKATTTMAVVD